MIYIIRHGETFWNSERKLQGKTDTELNSKGIEDAHILKKFFEKKDISLIISSPLKRAYKTAQIISQNKINIITEEGLKERYFGKYEGMKFEKVIKILNSKEDNQFDITHYWWHNEEMEDVESIYQRALCVLENYINKYKDKNLIFLSHGCVLETLIYHFLHIPFDKPKRLKIPNCTCLELIHTNETFFVNSYFSPDTLRNIINS